MRRGRATRRLDEHSLPRRARIRGWRNRSGRLFGRAARGPQSCGRGTRERDRRKFSVPPTIQAGKTAEFQEPVSSRGLRNRGFSWLRRLWPTSSCQARGILPMGAGFRAPSPPPPHVGSFERLGSGPNDEGQRAGKLASAMPCRTLVVLALEPELLLIHALSGVTASRRGDHRAG